MRLGLFNASVAILMATIGKPVNTIAIQGENLVAINDQIPEMADLTLSQTAIDADAETSGPNGCGIKDSVLTGPAISALLSGYNPMKMAVGTKTGYGRSHVDDDCCCTASKCPLAQRDLCNSIHNRPRRLAYRRPCSHVCRASTSKRRR